MSTYDTHDALLNDLLSFSPELDDADIFVPNISSSPSGQSSSSPLFPSPHDSVSHSIRFLSQNVNPSNIATHAILNISSLSRSTYDVVLIQEPWFGMVGTDTSSSSSSGKEVRGIRASTPRTCTGGFDASGSSERSEIGTAVFSAFDTSSSP